MAFEKSHRSNDCVIVSLANYFGYSYDKVYQDLARHGGPVNGDPNRGYFRAVWSKAVAEYLGRPPIVKHPRRGQDRLTGLLHVASPGGFRRHLTIVLDGIVFDTNGTVLPIAEYKLRHRYVVRSIWS
jgi:hypothetical protein